MKKHSIATALALLCLCGAARADITNGLVLCLPLDETNGMVATDLSGSGNNAALINAPSDNSQWVSGWAGGAVSFNPAASTNQYATIADSPSLNFSNSLTFTLAVWVKAPATQTNGAGIICKGSGGGGEQFALDISSGKFRAYVRSAAGASTAVVSSAAPSNVWQHVAVVCDGVTAKTLTIYINGQTNASVTAPTSLLYNTHVLSIGSRESSASSGFNWPLHGIVDDVRVYSRALSASDVSELYLRNGRAPVVLTQMRDLTCYVGDLLNFGVTIDPNTTVPLFCQWKKNDSNMVRGVGVTGAGVALSSLQLDDAATYTLQISNSVGVTVSSNWVLTVRPLPLASFTDSLVGWWKCDESSGSTTVADSSGNGNTAALLNFADPAQCWVAGAVNGGLLFNADGSGSNLLAIPNVGTPSPAIFDFSSHPAFTLAAWVKASLTQTNGGAIVAKGMGNGGEAFALDVYNNRFRSVVRDSNSIGLSLSGAVAPSNYWQHVAASFNASNGLLRLYVNGKNVGNAITRFSLLSNTHEVSIGNRQSGTNGYDLPYTGVIDDVRIYSRDLTSADVQALVLASGFGPAATIQPSLAAVYPGGSVTFTASATGTNSLSYQWCQNGASLVGKTSATLVLTNVQAANAGNYSVIVSNLYGAVTSQAAVLQLLPVQVSIGQAMLASGGILELTGVGPTNGASFRVLTSTNVALPLSQWTPVITNSFQINGQFSFSAAVATNGPARFYNVVTP